MKKLEERLEKAILLFRDERVWESHVIIQDLIKKYVLITIRLNININYLFSFLDTDLYMYIKKIH